MPPNGKKKAKKVVMKVRKKNQSSPAVAKSVRSNSKYNLLVTFNSNRTSAAETEIVQVMGKIGENPKIAATQSDGTYKLIVSDPRKVTERLLKICQADPEMFSSTYRYTPIDEWCKAEIKIMQSRIKKLVPEIEGNEKWKLSLNKRFWDKMKETELILKLTEVIDCGNTNLEKPDKIVQVEIIGKDAGISLLAPDEILTISKIKKTS